MYTRKRAIGIIKGLLENKPILDDKDIGDGRILKAVTTIIDVPNLASDTYPIITIIPAPHVIKLGLLGHFMDSTYRIAIYGYVTKPQNDDLFNAGEDVIEFITHELTKEVNVRKMIDNEFSIVEIGPILNEQYDADGNIGYISMQLAIQFVEN